MYIIVGLGNPTSQYNGTRHNIGFEVIDSLAEANGIRMDIKKHKAVCGMGLINGRKVLLAKPVTFMNLSGEAVRSMADFYKVDPKEDIIVVYDDISLDVGQLRIRAKGSAGGHNGIKSIISHLGTQDFKRVKFGVGNKPEGYDLADYVLGHFSSPEKLKVAEGIKRAGMAIETILADGINTAMNQFNSGSTQ